MAQRTSYLAPTATTGLAVSLTESFTEAALRLQGAQFAALVFWQQAVLAMNNELWDEWACRWAGGVPLDG